jgi:hypothetical protein
VKCGVIGVAWDAAVDVTFHCFPESGRIIASIHNSDIREICKFVSSVLKSRMHTNITNCTNMLPQNP